MCVYLCDLMYATHHYVTYVDIIHLLKYLLYIYTTRSTASPRLEIMLEDAFYQVKPCEPQRSARMAREFPKTLFLGFLVELLS